LSPSSPREESKGWKGHEKEGSEGIERGWISSHHLLDTPVERSGPLGWGAVRVREEKAGEQPIGKVIMAPILEDEDAACPLVIIEVPVVYSDIIKHMGGSGEQQQSSSSSSLTIG